MQPAVFFHAIATPTKSMNQARHAKDIFSLICVSYSCKRTNKRGALPPFRERKQKLATKDRFKKRDKYSKFTQQSTHNKVNTTV